MFGAPAVLLIVVSIFYALGSTNPALTLFAILTPLILARFLWRNKEIPFLFGALLLQWLSITVKIYYANYLDKAFQSVYDYPDHIRDAFTLSLIGIIMISLGIYVINYGTKAVNTDVLTFHALNINIRKLLRFYIIVIILYPILNRLSFTLGGLQQPLSKLLDFKWALFTILFIATTAQKQYQKQFIILVVIEILIGLTGFFSSFKDYLFILLIIYIGFNYRKLRIGQLIGLSIIMTILIVFVFSWQSIKQEYRKYLTEGKLTQTSTRSTFDALSKLNELVGTIDQKKLNEGFELTVNRLSYIDYFSATQSHVPLKEPFANGELWGGALGRIFQPRIFFPNKKVIDDSEKTTKYTGIQVAGREQGTSISLGYITETYVDFGPLTMHFILFLFGCLIGLIYRYVINNSHSVLYGFAFTTPLFLIIYSYETALDKMMGAIVMYFIIYLVISKFFQKSLVKYIQY